MDTIEFFGTFRTGDSEVVGRTLRDWLGGAALAVKVGRVGVEIVHEGAELYLFCHEAGADPGQPPVFLLEGHRDGTLEAAQARLRELSRLCAQRGLGCRLEFVQVNEDGVEVSEELTVE